METCFAWEKNIQGDYICSALIKKCDGCNKECRFYKTPEQYQIDKHKINKHLIKSFGLFIDGRKHGDFDNIKAIDDYLMNFYANNKEWENERARRYRSVWDSGDWQMVYFNHNIHFAYPKE